MPAPTRPAATVILLRPEGDRFSVFLVQRSRAVGFMPQAWVFPGGRVDPADALLDHPGVRGGAQALQAMGVAAAEGVPYLVAAVRETFEESGLWLGDGLPPQAARDALNTRGSGVTLAQVLEEHAAVADLDRLVSWSWWITPEAEPRRYDTRFFVAVVDGEGGVHDDGETVASAWVPIDQAVQQARVGELPMAPPTWWTLEELATCASLADVMASRRPQQPICPILSMSSSGLSLVLPGDPEHDAPAIPGLPTRVRFEQGRWWATH